jgi:hypothetical protein
MYVKLFLLLKTNLVLNFEKIFESLDLFYFIHLFYKSTCIFM